MCRQVQAKARAHCRSICGEMHSGFANLRAALQSQEAAAAAVTSASALPNPEVEAGSGQARAATPLAKCRIADRNSAMRALCDQTAVASPAASIIRTASCAGSKPASAGLSKLSWSPSTRIK